MQKKITSLKRLPAWKGLAEHSKEISKLHLRELFANDSTRGERLAVQGAGLFLVYSKNRVTETTLKLLQQLAQRIILELEGSSEPELKHDSSTNNLIRRYRQMKQQPWKSLC